MRTSDRSTPGPVAKGMGPAARVPGVRVLTVAAPRTNLGL